MREKNEDKKPETGIYETIIHKITQWVKPKLQKKTEDFVKKSVDEHAKDDPRFASIIEFEVKRRGEGAGITQDVAEPLLWTGVKTASALGVAAVTESAKDNKIKMVGRFTALGIILNSTVDLFRLVPRYVAGLQGSLEMAKERQRSIKETGVDPFDNGVQSEIVKNLENKSWVDSEKNRDSTLTNNNDRDITR